MGFIKPNIQKLLNQKDIPGLIKALADNHDDVRVAAVAALVKIGGQAIELLIAEINNKTPERFRSIPVLAKMVLEFQENGLREQALHPIQDSLHSEDASLRLTAALSLKEITMLTESQELLDEIQSSLLDTLSDPEPKVCQVIIDALEPFGESAGKHFLVIALMNAHAEIRQLAIEKLGNMRYTQAVEPLLGTFGTRDLEERIHIVKALGQIGDAHIVLPLLNSIDAAQKETSREMLIVGGAETAQQSHQRIRNLHQYEDAVYDALEKIGASAVDELILAVGDENKWIRENASQLLGKINDLRAVEPLLNAFGNEDARIRNMAAYVLGKIGDVRAVPSLFDALKDGDENVRRSAAFALGKCGDPRAIEPLMAELKSDSLWIRREAAVLLGNLHNAAALEPLQALLEDTDKSVRIAAGEAIEKITGN